jgi:hypothetical protein
LNQFDYFSEIEQTFIRRRGKILLLSPLDWTLIENWKKRGIPQQIVIRSIEKVFDEIAKDPRRNPNIKSISYCADEVERQFRDWQASQAGSHRDDGATAEDDVKTKTREIVGHLRGISEALRAAAEKIDGELHKLYEDSIQGLETLSEGIEISRLADPETVEIELSKLESTIDDALVKNAGKEELETARRSVGEHLKQYAGKMQQEVYEKTFELMVIKKLREKAGIPAFSLFYL